MEMANYVSAEMLPAPAIEKQMSILQNPITEINLYPIGWNYANRCIWYFVCIEINRRIKTTANTARAKSDSIDHLIPI